jgi:hypothetical protein
MSEFRELSDQEYAALEVESGEVVVIDEKKPIELGRKIWKLAMQAQNRDQICEKLGIPIELLEETLSVYRRRLGQSIDDYRLLDNERVDRLLAYWLPAALDRDEDPEFALKAAGWAVNTMERRLKILSATATLAGITGDDSKPYTERSIVIWLKECLPAIENITRELELEKVES